MTGGTICESQKFPLSYCDPKGEADEADEADEPDEP